MQKKSEAIPVAGRGGLWGCEIILTVTSRGFIIILLLFILTVNWFLPDCWDTTIKHNTKKYTSYKITHHAGRKHSTQSYTNNKGRITRNECTQKLKLFL
jgi:hypothetical protein